MTTNLRPSTLTTLGLPSVGEFLAQGRPPVSAGDLVDRVFGPAGERGALVVSGANGIVGAGKTMQLGARLAPFGVPVVALDFPGVADGLGPKFGGLVRAFGREQAAAIMANVVELSYDGANLPPALAAYRPRVLIEAIPEVLAVKRAHYEVFRQAFPGIEIRSVTSGFPSSELGVGIAHPAFPHEINKVWEVVEATPSPFTRLLWALGMIPVPVGDHWSFVLDVLFCGLTNAALRFHEAGNMPFWKIDKLVRRRLGPNPLRAHDAIGARGANFLTWSCLHHLAERYGPLFEPTVTLVEHKDAGTDWYPPNHFRPVLGWPVTDADAEELDAWVLGALLQMTSLMLHEERAHLSHMNAIGELCAQFRKGILALARELGPDRAVAVVEAYQRLHPEAVRGPWHPEAFAAMGTAAWQQLYVNAEHDGAVGVVTIARESYNADVDAELNRAIDWLLAAGIERVVVTGDFHLATQMVGADTVEFFPALEREAKGVEIAATWSATARRLHDEFAVSVAFVNGKRCLGGFLELVLHCHFVVAVEDASLGMPEVTLPVVPGMEGCHWPLRKVGPEQWPRLLRLLLSGEPVRAADAEGWLIDRAAPMEEAIGLVRDLVTGADGSTPLRRVAEAPLVGVADALPELPAAGGPQVEAARRAILETVKGACGVPLAEALQVQARHSGGFMVSQACREGVIGDAWRKTMRV